jgi:hypothetical protein
MVESMFKDGSWSLEIGSQIQDELSKKCIDIDLEIIDFLLQWFVPTLWHHLNF